MTSVLLLKLSVSGLVFAVLFFICTLATSDFNSSGIADFCIKICGVSLFFSALCVFGFVLIEIWK